MKRILFFLFSLFLSSQIFASHIKGGEIYYDYLGNNVYKFHLVLYRDITGVALPSSPGITISNIGPNNSLYLTKDSSVFINACTVDLEVGYYSGTKTITAVPTAGSFVEWTSCCRAPGIDNMISSGSQSFTIKAYMLPVPGQTYASSSPRFYSNDFTGYANHSNVLNTAAYDPNFQDSIHVEFTNVLGNNGSTISYQPGYSHTQPFGTTAPSTINQNTGIVTVNNPANGVYAVGMRVNTYREGQYTGYVMRDLSYYIEPLQDSLPQFTIANLTTSGTASIQGNSMLVEMLPGDSIGFSVIGNVANLDSIALSGESRLFGNTAGTVGSCTGNNCASLTSSNFTGLGSVSGQFSFAPDTAIFSSGNTSYVRTVLLNLTTNTNCNASFTTPFAVYITVNKPQSIWSQSQLAICSGDSAQAQIQGDTANISWSPVTGVSDPTSASPWLSPLSTTTYTITNLNDSAQIQLTVNVDSITHATLVDNSTWVELPNFTDYDQVVWYYNGIPLAANVDSFAMPWPGDYFAYVTHGSCSALTDTVIKVNKNMTPVFGSGSNTVVSTDGFAEFEFKLNGVHGNVLQSLNVALPDSGTYKTSSEPWFLLTDGNQTIVATGTASKVSDGYYSLTGLNVTLNANETYKVFMDLYSGPTVFSAPTSFPYTEDNGLITVLSALYEDAGVQKNNAYPAVVFGLSSGIGLLEVDMREVIVYPNPTTNVLNVKVYQPTQLVLLSTTGKVLYEGSVSKNGLIDIQNLASGVYILQTNQNGTIRHQKVIKR